MHWDYGWGMGFGWIFMVLFWALVILNKGSVSGLRSSEIKSFRQCLMHVSATGDYGVKQNKSRTAIEE